MSDSPQAIYNANVSTLAAVQQAAEEKYDAILTTLGSGFLALSVSFVKDIVPLATAQWIAILYLSWFAFGLTIVLTVVSLGIGYSAVAWHRKRLTPDAYPDQELLSHNPWNRAIRYLNVSSGIAFIFGVMFTVIFVVSNIAHWRTTMATRIPTQGEVLQKGLTIPPMQTGTAQPNSLGNTSQTVNSSQTSNSGSGGSGSSDQTSTGKTGGGG